MSAGESDEGSECIVDRVEIATMIDSVKHKGSSSVESDCSPKHHEDQPRSNSEVTTSSSCDGERQSTLIVSSDSCLESSALLVEVPDDGSSFNVRERGAYTAQAQAQITYYSSPSHRRSSSDEVQNGGELKKTKSFKMRMKGKVLKAIKMDSASVEMRHRRRMSVERVSLENICTPYIMDLKAPDCNSCEESCCINSAAASDDKKPLVCDGVNNDGVLSSKNTISRASSNSCPHSMAADNVPTDGIWNLCIDDEKSPTRSNADASCGCVLARSSTEEATCRFHAPQSPSDAHCAQPCSSNDVCRDQGPKAVLRRRTSNPEVASRLTSISRDPTQVSRRASMTTIYMKNRLEKRRDSLGNIAFSPTVQVIPIPRIKDYPRATRKMMWGSSLGHTYVRADIHEEENSDLFF